MLSSILSLLALILSLCFSPFGLLTIWSAWLPSTYAASTSMPFPDIPFGEFAKFIQLNFRDDISLATVLVLLFSLTENPQFLNLHGRRQHSKWNNEPGKPNTGWINAFSQLLLEIRLKEICAELFLPHDGIIHLNPDVPYCDKSVIALSAKLNAMITLLKLNPFKHTGHLAHRQKTISYSAIEPIRLVCPGSYQCQSPGCLPLSLAQHTRYRDIPQVTLLKGTDVCKYAFVLQGFCNACKTSYYADRERIKQSPTSAVYNQCYINSAPYLKLGQSLWGDRIFTNCVTSATYSFHASASAFTEFFNDSFGRQAGIKITRRHIWQAYVHETIRMVAQDSDVNLIVPDKVTIDEVTDYAFQLLGANGFIKASESHSCSECSHEQQFGPNEQNQDPQDYEPVRMVVVDGIVMSPTVSGSFWALKTYTKIKHNFL